MFEIEVCTCMCNYRACKAGSFRRECYTQQDDLLFYGFDGKPGVKRENIIVLEKNLELVQTVVRKL